MCINIATLMLPPGGSVSDHLAHSQVCSKPTAMRLGSAVLASRHSLFSKRNSSAQRQGMGSRSSQLLKSIARSSAVVRPAHLVPAFCRCSAPAQIGMLHACCCTSIDRVCAQQCGITPCSPAMLVIEARRHGARTRQIATCTGQSGDGAGADAPRCPQVSRVGRR